MADEENTLLELLRGGESGFGGEGDPNTDFGVDTKRYTLKMKVKCTKR
jgi:hypothetical protein